METGDLKNHHIYYYLFYNLNFEETNITVHKHLSEVQKNFHLTLVSLAISVISNKIKVNMYLN